MAKTLEVTVTYQRRNASGEQCVIRHQIDRTQPADASYGNCHTYPEFVEWHLKNISLHQEFLRSGWYQKQFEYDPN